MAQTKVGRILPAAKGTHNPEQGYEQLDIVMAPDGSEVYMARQTVPAGIELSNTEYWMVYAQMGKVFEELSEKIAQTIGQTVTPQMYGAVGDGKNDDGSAFEQALNSGKNVYVPAGRYKIGRVLTIPSGVKMYGDSVISKYTAMVENGDKNADAFDSGKDSILVFEGLEECIRYGMKTELSGLVISGSNCQYGVVPDLNVITQESNCVFRDLLIYNFAKIGLAIGNREAGSAPAAYCNYIYRVNCAYCETGLWINSSDNTVMDSQFFRNRLFGYQVRQAQNFVYNTLSFHNAEAADGGDPANGAEARFNACTETFLYACAFDSGIIDVGIRMTGGCDIKMHNCRIKGSNVTGVYCDAYSKVTADYLIINNNAEAFVPVQSKNADNPSLLRDPVCVATQYDLNVLENVYVVDSYNVKGSGAVESVNGKTGVVELTAADVGALPVDTEIPDTSAFITRVVNDLENYYLKSQTYNRTEIDQKISTIPKFSISVVSALPSTGISATTIYLVPGGADDNLYTEYINVNGTWEVLGSQRVDLTGYATQTWTLEQLKGYQPKGDYALKSELPTVPTNVSAFQNDAKYAKQSELPTALSQLSEDSAHRVVTDVEKAAWNAKSNFSGKYADLDGKPTIPTVPTNVSAFENDAGYLTQHQDISGKLDANKLPEAINAALAQAKESGEFDGEDGYTPVKGKDYTDGDDGVSPIVTVSAITGGHRITITDVNGAKTVDVMDGSKGDSGRGISTIARTSGNGAAGTTDTYTITYSDGTKSTFSVYNGKNGDPGKTPVKGTDYWTAADQQQMVQDVIAALPDASEVSY